ncbi:MAG: trypsin-like peptidase domain-containing protein [Parcubacteria group bacterium]|nr:trypsin-like peptidase domain-containing protein [Parcubacteria group bacterium]
MSELNMLPVHNEPAKDESRIPLSTLRGLITLVLLFGLLGGGMAGAVVTSFINTGKVLPTGMDSDLTSGVPLVVTAEDSVLIDVVEKASSSVVSIIIEKPARQATGPGVSPFDFFNIPGFEFVPQQTPQPQSDVPVQEEMVQVGAGTGFVVSEKGLILTNRHVVQDKEATYSILSRDGQKYEVEILGVDPANDLAVVKTKEEVKLAALELGSSDSIKIGQTVLAIGNSLGQFSNTVTKGVISGINRRVTASDGLGGSETLESAIQTDAAINPGNSGGPLLNVAGQVIGVNTAVSREGQLIGFAIPINDAVRLIDSIEKYGRIVRPYLGVRYTIVDKQLQKLNQLPVDYGALLRRGERAEELAVIPGGPADRAGLEENDIVLEINGQKVDVNNSLVRIVGKYNPGDVITLKVLKDGKERDVKLTLGEFKEETK